MNAVTKYLMRLLTITFLYFVTAGYAQAQAPKPLSYSILPTDGTVGMQKATITVPFGKFSFGAEKGFLFLAGNYTYASFSFANKYPSVSTSQLEQFHHFGLVAGYRRPLNTKWNIMGLAMPQISSNLRSKLEGKDLRGTGVIMLEKINSMSTSFLRLGMVYSTQMSFPIPLISYRRIMNNQWEYTVGMPRTEIRYSLTSRSTIQSFVESKGFSGNISNPVLEVEQDKDSKLMNIMMIGGIGYSYNLRKRIAISLEGGYSLFNMLKIQNYDRDNMYDFGINNKLYYNIGLQVKL